VAGKANKAISGTGGRLWKLSFVPGHIYVVLAEGGSCLLFVLAKIHDI